MPRGNKPKYYLKLTDKRNTKQRTLAGVAFENEYKQLSIVLYPGVVIKWDDELYITLNLYDDTRPLPLGAVMPSVKREEAKDDKDDKEEGDDISF